MTPPMTVHFVEPGGQGGVFQHTAEVARLVVKDGGRAVIHTAADHESLEFGDITVCGCVEWYRDARPRPVRNGLIVSSYLFKTLPHLTLATKGHVVHLQGLFKSPLYSITLWLLAWRAARMVFSPHNTFSRSDRRWEAGILRWSLRRTDVAVCYSAFDVAQIKDWGVVAVVCPLAQWTPKVTAEEVAVWKTLLSHDAPSALVLVAGQIRADKGIDQMILAAPLIDIPFTLAVVGEDKGDLSRCRQLAEQNGVDVVWLTRYVTTRELAGAIAAADVVVLPYSKASQSGVAALANALGTPTVAYPVGGLPELATVTAARCDPAALADAVMRVLSTEEWSICEPLRDIGPFAQVYGS
jgi:glycosyltransferase involved in cell wall biosynthesis